MNKLRTIFHLGKNIAFSKTAISTYLVFSGNVLSAFLAFVATVFLVRNLSFSNFGYFSSLWSLLLLVSDLADIGIGTSLASFLPPLENKKEVLLRFIKTAFVLQLFLSSTVAVLIFLFSSSISDILFHTQSYDQLVKITAVAIFFSIMSNFYQFALAARQKFIKVAILSSFSSLIRVILIIILIALHILALKNTIYVHALALFLLTVISAVFFGFEFFKHSFHKEDLKDLLSFTYLLGIARGLTAVASRLDVLMIIALKGPTEAGIYATASRIISIYPLLSGSFSTVIAPKLSSIKTSKEIKSFIFKVILATLGIISTVVFLIIFSSPFLSLLFGSKGIVASSTFQLLLTSMIFFVASIPSVSLAIYYLKKPFILSINSVLQLVVVFVGNLIFIPLFGRFGAAYSLIIAYSVSLVLTTFMTYYYLQKKHE